MKNTFLIFCLLSIIGCSSDDSSTKEVIVPEKFDIKIEIKGKYEVPEAHIGINSTVVKKWNYFDLPFTGEYTYYTTGSEVSTNSCKCITINAWAYISQTNEMEVLNLYVNGKLVDSETVSAASTSNGILNPTIVEFIYRP